MPFFPRIVSFTRNLLQKRERDADIDNEISSQLELLTDQKIKEGLSPDEARRAAKIELGGVEQLKEQVRAVRTGAWLDSLLQDIRYAVRMLRKNPGFTAVAVLTLALGIGANTAIFSVVYAVLLKPLPFAEPQQLFNVFEVQPQEGVTGTGWSYANFAELRAQNHIFSEMAGNQQHQLTLTGRGEPAVVNTAVVTPEVFPLLGIKPMLGRTFLPEEGKPGAAPVALISEGLWRTTFAADPKVVGTPITLDKRSCTIVGIMPATFRFPAISEQEQVWIPLAQDPLFGSWMDKRGGHWLRVTGRLKPGVSLVQAQAELDAISARLAREFPAENQ